MSFSRIAYSAPYLANPLADQPIGPRSTACVHGDDFVTEAALLLQSPTVTKMVVLVSERARSFRGQLVYDSQIYLCANREEQLYTRSWDVDQAAFEPLQAAH